MYASLYVTVQSTVYSWLDKLVTDKLDKAAIDSSSVVSPTKNLIPESMVMEWVVSTAAPSSFRPSEFSLPVAAALQLHIHETSRVVTPPVVNLSPT